jgi:glycosyltransferase involved in cell wall biosynthesis
MMDVNPLVSIVIPHWQVQDLMKLCLRSIRRYTSDIPYEVLVVDNGSRDASLDYLRSLGWIRLIERGESTPDNWVLAMATALDMGISQGRGKYLLIMHSDVVIRQEGWLKLLVEAIESGPAVGSSGTGKLESVNAFLRLWKKTFNEKKIKAFFRRVFTGDKSVRVVDRPDCPRDFCALYRMDLLRKYGLSFVQRPGLSAGDTMYAALSEKGHNAAMIPVGVMMKYIDHVAHGTAAARPGERRLRHAHTQRRTERRLVDLFNEPHMRSLMEDDSLDR